VVTDLNLDTGLEPESVPALDAVEALSGFCRLVRRSGSLDGSLPMRAVQHCTPVVHGSAAGFQVVLDQPITLHRGRTGVVVTLRRPWAERMQRDAATALARMVDRGWLERNGLWERLFRHGAIPMRGDHLLVWTGWLVRPAADTCLLVSGAYNRRSRVAVREHLVTNFERFTPLVLEIDVSGLTTRPVWLEGEIGCVTPLAPAVRFVMRPLASAPDVGASVLRFYDASYFAEKRIRATGRYRKLHAGLSSEAAPRADCQLVYAGSRVHRVTSRWRCLGPDGWGIWSGSKGQVLEQAIVRSECLLEANWDGHTISNVRAHTIASRRRFTRLWRRLYGPEVEDALAYFRDHLLRAPLDEPYFVVQPWIFVATPPGWTSILDGFHGAIYDGMRGVIATDVYSTVSMAYRLNRPGRVRIAKAAPLLRILPVPRAVLHRPLRQFAADGDPPRP
jgi:hypothetical protein